MNAVAPTPSVSSSPSRPTEGPRARIADLLAAIVRFAKARPYAAVGATAIAGFVVGGALSFRGGRVLLAAGVKNAGQELLKHLL
jgi:hypothetical protein